MTSLAYQSSLLICGSSQSIAHYFVTFFNLTMAEILQLQVASRGSHESYNRPPDAYHPPNYDSFSHLVTYSPNTATGDSSTFPTPHLADVASEQSDTYLKTAARGAPSLQGFSTTDRSSYYRGTPPSLYPPSSLANMSHMTNSGSCNYAYPYAFGSSLSMFDGSAPYTSTYACLAQQEGAPNPAVSRVRNQRSMHNDTAKASKKKVSSNSVIVSCISNFLRSK